MKRTIAVLTGLVLTLLAPAGRPAFRDPAPNPNLDTQLRSTYIWTQADGATGQIIRPGSVLVVRKEGISTNPVTAPLNAQNNYKDGQLKRSALNFFTQEQATAGWLRAGDRVFVTKTEVKESSVVLSLLSTDSFEGMRVKASVAFQFPKGFLATAEFGPVARVIDEVLAIESEARPTTPAPVSQAILPPQPPPQPPPTAAPATVDLGASADQVLAALGPPNIIADLGRKQLFIYSDLKVTFLDGKVSDVK